MDYMDRLDYIRMVSTEHASILAVESGTLYRQDQGTCPGALSSGSSSSTPDCTDTQEYITSDALRV